MKRILVDEEVFERFTEESQTDGGDVSITLARLLDLRNEEKPTSPLSYSVERLESWRKSVETK